MSNVLLMLSGGRDSFLSACKLVEEGKHVSLVSFNNGMSVGDSNVEYEVTRLINHYGQSNIEWLGIQSIVDINTQMRECFIHMKPEQILSEYGNVTVSQLNCSCCRAAMYYTAIQIAKRNSIGIIAEGARRCQQFAIELPEIIRRFSRILNHYGLKLSLPVYDLSDDWNRDNELLRCGFVCKTLEPKCLIGVPIPGGVLPDDVLKGSITFFDKAITPILMNIDY